MPAFFLAAWKWLGVKGAAIIAAVLAFGALLLKARHDGAASAAAKIQVKEQKADETDIKKASDARVDADRVNSDPGKLRTDDGYERQ